MRSFRPVLFGLLALTILVRGLVPIMHGSMMASDSGNPLLAAFCGTSSAALAAKTQAQAPWLTGLNQSPTDDSTAKSACPLCVATAAALVLLAFTLLLLALRTPALRPIVAPLLRPRDEYRRPPARAPPAAFPLAI